MNVTLKLPDHLVREARHLALDENTSLSALVVELLTRKLEERTAHRSAPKSWIDAFSGEPDDKFLERDFPMEDRKIIPIRETVFEPDEQ